MSFKTIFLFKLFLELAFKKIEVAITALASSLKGNDPDLIIEHTKNLNALTENFAGRMMDQSVGEALKGQSIDKLNF